MVKKLDYQKQAVTMGIFVLPEINSVRHAADLTYKETHYAYRAPLFY